MVTPFSRELRGDLWLQEETKCVYTHLWLAICPLVLLKGYSSVQKEKKKPHYQHSCINPFKAHQGWPQHVFTVIFLFSFTFLRPHTQTPAHRDQQSSFIPYSIRPLKYMDLKDLSWTSPQKTFSLITSLKTAAACSPSSLLQVWAYLFRSKSRHFW